MNATAICITLIICATLVILTIINKGGNGSSRKDKHEKGGELNDPPKMVHRSTKGGNGSSRKDNDKKEGD